MKPTIKEALLYQPLADSRVRCTACARYCNIPEGKIGLCGVRQNIGGKLHLLVYGKVITGHIDPIEKKPVVHYMPGSKIFSIATTGCNWLCHPAGAEILLSNGDKKPVEELLPGDSLWSYDIDNGMNIHPNVVTRTGSRLARIWDLRYGARGAGRLSLTAEHPIMTDSGWKSVEKVAPGEKILKAWYQNTKDWKRKRPGSIQRAVFNCTKCGESVKGIDNWNRHRGRCYTEGMGMSPEVREHHRQRMISDNPMKDPDVARRAIGSSKERFLRDPNHGWHRNTERLRIWLHRHPSEGQKRLYELLDEMGLEYDQEYRIKPEHRLPDSRATYIADAAFPDSKLDIEVDGWWHYKHERTREGDIVRDQTLRANGWQVLRISGRHVYDHREEVKALIVQHLAAPLMLNKRTWVDVTSVKPTEHFKPVYSFECIPNHNYVGDGIILHNCSYCFTPDTSLFTTRGVKTFAELYQEGSNETGNGLSSKRNISGISSLTHRGRFRRIKEVFRHFYEGPVLTIKPWYLPALRCTPDHGILTTTDPEKTPRKVQARFITKKNYLLLPKTRAHEHVTRLDLSVFLKGIDLPKYKAIRSSRQWRLTHSTLRRIVEMSRSGRSSREIGEVLRLHPGIVERARARLSRSSPTGLSTPYSRYRVSVSKGTVRLSNSKHTLPRFIDLDEDFAKLLGYYCADGSTSKQINRPNSFTVCFTFGKDETSNVGDVRELVKRLFGLECSVTKQGSAVHVYLSNSILGHLFTTLCGNDTYSKKVPEFVLSSSHKGIVKAFLTGYLNGDGYKTAANGNGDKSFLGANSVSKSLSLGVSLLFLKIGSVPRFYVGENGPTPFIEGRLVSRHTDYLVKVLKRNSSSSRETLEWEDIRGLVVEREDCYLIPVKSVSSESYRGFVYNMEVEEDHTYLANFFAVSNCQNFDISQRRKVEGTDLMPPDVVSLALSHGCQGIAYTYNQPTIFMEFARDIGVEARKNGLINIFVSNGFDTPDTVAMMDDFLDCITIDFKGSGETNFVRKHIGIPDAQPIFQTIQEIRDRGKAHIEITDLVVPEIGDNLDEARKLSRWLYDNLGPDVPIHFLRFHPDYKLMHLPSTPVKTLEEHCRVAREEGLRYVYVGNVTGHPWEHTYCPECRSIAIKRYGFDITGWNLDDKNRCMNCGYKLPIFGQLSSSVSEDRFLPVVN